MAGSLSNFVNNIFEGIHIIKCKYRHGDKECETCRIKIATVFLNIQNFKDNLTECKCF